jgi:zinc protease
MPAAAETRTPVRPHRATLGNGLVVILRENHANPTVAVQGLVRAGAIYDPPGRAGLAAFVAAMLDRGTSRRSALEQASAIEDVGAHLAFEGNTETAGFSGTALVEDLPLLLDVLADALQSPAFPPDQAEKARDELLNEVRRADDSTASTAARAANRLLFPESHPYHWPSFGTEPSLRAVTRDELAAFHAGHYGPQTTILVLVGDVTPETALPLVERAFGGWNRLAAPPAFTVPPAPAPASPLRCVVRMPGRSQTDVAWALPGFARTAPDYHAAMIMNYVFGGGSLSSRLMEHLRDRLGLVYGVYSMLTPGIGAGPIQIRAGTNPANVDRAVEAIGEQLRRMHDEGPTDGELEEAKGYLTGVFPVRLESNAGVAAQLVAAQLYGLGLDYLERYIGLIRDITLDDVRGAARKYFTPGTHVLAIAGSYNGSAKASS